ncbi:MAG: type II toxin-antitoxin system RelE/ParE family toxin [Halieaceae bacterium]|nr:type II toxin-antitoxin system RelE/ParE family toxin [Halieaceae bacterium]
MAAYRLTRDAQSDLIEIRRYTVQEWGAVQSQKYLSELRKTIRLLAEVPSLGKARPEAGLKVLSFPYASHVIYYVVHEQVLVVFAVLHKRMVPLDHMVG